MSPGRRAVGPGAAALQAGPRSGGPLGARARVPDAAAVGLGCVPKGVFGFRVSCRVELGLGVDWV